MYVKYQSTWYRSTCVEGSRILGDAQDAGEMVTITTHGSLHSGRSKVTLVTVGRDTKQPTTKMQNEGATHVSLRGGLFPSCSGCNFVLCVETKVQMGVQSLFYSVYGRRPRCSTFKQQLHTKTHHQCQNVCLGVTREASSFQETRTARHFQDSEDAFQLASGRSTLHTLFCWTKNTTSTISSEERRTQILMMGRCPTRKASEGAACRSGDAGGIWSSANW